MYVQNFPPLIICIYGKDDLNQPVELIILFSILFCHNVSLEDNDCLMSLEIERLMIWFYWSIL
jgi:hypothetical protein